MLTTTKICSALQKGLNKEPIESLLTVTEMMYSIFKKLRTYHNLKTETMAVF